MSAGETSGCWIRTAAAEATSVGYSSQHIHADTAAADKHAAAVSAAVAAKEAPADDDVNELAVTEVL